MTRDEILCDLAKRIALRQCTPFTSERRVHMLACFSDDATPIPMCGVPHRRIRARLEVTTLYDRITCLDCLRDMARAAACGVTEFPVKRR